MWRNLHSSLIRTHAHIALGPQLLDENTILPLRRLRLNICLETIWALLGKWNVRQLQMRMHCIRRGLLIWETVQSAWIRLFPSAACRLCRTTIYYDTIFLNSFFFLLLNANACCCCYCCYCYAANDFSLYIPPKKMTHSLCICVCIYRIL